MNLAFKDADLAGGLFSKAIKWKTGGPYSHVEIWMTGPREKAVCFSSREPNGTGYAVIDLSAPLYTCVEIICTPEQMTAISWFCEGIGYRRYGFLAILGFVWPWGEHDRATVICSECATNVCQTVLGMFKTDKDGKPVRAWTVSPSALYEMAADAAIRKGRG